MIALTQIASTEIFALITVLVFKLFTSKVLITNRKDIETILKSRLLFKKIANFMTTLLQNNYKYLECEIFRILLKYASDHL